MRAYSLLNFVAATALTGQMAVVAQAGDWNRFRGPNGQGVSTDKAVPAVWNEKTNLKWKTPLPGPGASSPIVVGKHVFVTCYSGYGESRSKVGKKSDLKRHLVCVNRDDGKIVWSKTVKHEGREDDYSRMLGEHGYASNTPASDGKQIFAFFGKSGVYAFDMQGNQQWRKSVGTESGRMRWGSGASLLLYKNLVIVNASEESESIYGFDKKTGKQVWKAQAAGLGNTWGTPVLVKTKDRTELVIAVPYEIWGLNPDTGKLLWYTEDGISDSSMCSSLAVKGDVVYAVGGRGGGSVAVRAGGKGNVTKTHTLWTGRASGRINTPVVHDERIYWVSSGIANCISAKDGKSLYRSRIGGGSSSGGRTRSGGGSRRGGRFGRGGGYGGGQTYCSPIVVNGKVIMLTRDGTAHVYKAGEKYTKLATNSLKDGSDFHSTPAVGGAGDLYIRSSKYLYCIAKTAKKEKADK